MSDPPKVQPIADVKGTDDAKFDVNNFLIIAGIGIIILTCVSADYTEDGSSGPASKGLWGYGLLGIALFGMLIYGYRSVLKKSRKSTAELTAWEFGKQAVLSAGAPGSYLFVVVCLIALNGQFFSQINKGGVAPEYYNYNALATTIAAVQLGVLMRLFQAKSDGDATTDDNASALVYLLSVAGLVNAGIMAIILIFFTTDG